jgi:SPP1 family predicted phage head-tail adaptor
MRIGDLTKIIDIQAPTRTPDNMGGSTDTYVTVMPSVFAAIWPTSASETIENLQLGLNATHKIRIRYKPTIKSNWRIKFGDRYYNIVSIINPNMKNEILDLVCKEAA